ncbi:MAG: DUF1579 family protein [Acidobacteriota bacterium]
MPRPGAAHARLEKLVGTWRGEEKMSPSPWMPEGGTAIGEVTNRIAMDGFNVVQDYTQTRDGTVSFRGHGVFGWDDTRKEYTLHWFDSMGMPPNVFRGSFDGDTLTLSSHDPRVHSRTVFDFGAPGSYRFKMEMSQDGNAWHAMMEATYSRTD